MSIECIRGASEKETSEIDWKKVYPGKRGESVWKEYLQLWEEMLEIIEENKIAAIDINLDTSPRELEYLRSRFSILSNIFGVVIQTEKSVSEDGRLTLFVRLLKNKEQK